jgi:hypothetical protein
MMENRETRMYTLSKNAKAAFCAVELVLFAEALQVSLALGKAMKDIIIARTKLSKR